MMSSCNHANGNGGGSGGGGGVFPCKLHDMIDYAERNNLDDVISWTPNGLSFVVHHPNRLVNELLPLFFGLTKYRSFRRQLNIWSFDTIHQDGHSDSGSIGGGNNWNSNNKSLLFQHPYFIRGKKSICENMGRQTFKRTPKSTSSSTAFSISTSKYNTVPKSGNEAAPRQTSRPTFAKVSTESMVGNNRLINNALGGQLNKTWSNESMLMEGRISSMPSPPSSSIPGMTMMTGSGNQALPLLEIPPQVSFQNSMFANLSVRNHSNNDNLILPNKITSQTYSGSDGIDKGGHLDKIFTSHMNNAAHQDGDIVEFEGRSFHFVELE